MEMRYYCCHRDLPIIFQGHTEERTIKDNSNTAGADDFAARFESLESLRVAGTITEEAYAEANQKLRVEQFQRSHNRGTFQASPSSKNLNLTPMQGVLVVVTLVVIGCLLGSRMHNMTSTVTTPSASPSDAVVSAAARKLDPHYVPEPPAVMPEPSVPTAPSPPASSPTQDGSNSSESSSQPSSASQDPASASTSTSVVRVENIKGIGNREIGVVDKVAYIIFKIEKHASLGNEFSSTDADGIFVVVRAGAINGNKETHSVTTSLMTLLDDQGREFSPSSKGETALAMSGDPSSEMFMAEVQPGVAKRISLVYDVPESAKGFKLKIPSGMLSTDEAIVIKAP
jgi:hypothetical protein